MNIENEIKKTVNDVIALVGDEILEQRKLFDIAHDVKLKEVITNNIDALGDIRTSLMKNYVQIVSHPKESMLDMVYAKNTTLEYRHIRYTVLSKFI